MKKILFLLLALCLLSGCAVAPKSSVTLYFPAADGTKILEQSRTAPPEADRLTFAIRSLLEGPKTPTMRRVIPDGTSLLSIRMLGTVAEINFSAAFDTGTLSDRLLARYTVIYTACAVPDVQRVRLLVENAPLQSLKTGEPLGALGKTDVSLTVPTSQTPQLLTLYFPDAEGKYLYTETRKTNLSDGQTIENATLQALLEGPTTPGLSHPLVKDASLCSAETRAGICFVNLHASFLKENSGDTAKETMAVYSIVNSLCGIPHIQEVQFLIEGKKEKSFGHFALTRGFTENKTLYAPQ